MKNLKSILFLLLLISSSVLAVTVDVDTNFGASAYGQIDAGIHDIVRQSDGKFLVAGNFTEANGKLHKGIIRLNSDSSIDTTFNPPDFFPIIGSFDTVIAIALQNDGKILVGGTIRGFGTTVQPGIYRLNSDGSIDNSFTSTVQTLIDDIGILPDGSIVYAGIFGIAKVSANGTLIANVGSIGNIYDIEVLDNGKIYIGSVGNDALRRMNSDLTFDSTFATVPASGGKVNSIKVLSNGQLLVAGEFNKLNGFNVGRIARVNSNGAVDLNFNPNNSGANTSITDVHIKSNGKIIISGRFTQFNGQTRNILAQLNSNGTLDTSFQFTEPIIGTVSKSFLADNGDILIGLDNGLFESVSSQSTITKVLSNGSVDSSFNIIVTRGGNVELIRQNIDDKIYIAGKFRYSDEFESVSIARLNTDGSVDSSFVSALNNIGVVTVTDIEIQNDGKIIVCTSGFAPGIFRLNTDGSFDNSFTYTPVANQDRIFDAEILPDGKILIATFRLLLRLNSDGSVDSTFNTVIVNEASGAIDVITVQPDGKILLAGTLSRIGAFDFSRIARVNANGSLDNTFNPPSDTNVGIQDVKIQPDGKILVGGAFTQLGGDSSRNKIGRLNSDGSLDTTFAQVANGPVSDIELQSDGKILIGGKMSTVGGVPSVGIARLNSNGAVDSSFSVNAPGGLSDIEIQSDNNLLIGGDFLTVNGQPNVRVARLLNNAIPSSTQYDFDGDGSADLGVFRASNNVWYQLLGPNYNFSQTAFGIANDIVTPADFDGDGKTDLAIFRPASGDWWYLSSVTNTQVSVQFGQNGDIPRPSDFDGDGKADFIVFRPSTSQWLRYGSTVGDSNVNFGLTGDKPLVGDFDGDGKSDVAIYRPSTGDWWWQSSVDNSQRATHWGISSDIPTPGDYDGDGITDFAVYRPADGVWYVLKSSSGNTQATIIQFGIAEDKPIPADYDGDGKVDIAVYRPSTGVWYLLRSTAGFQAIQFGISSDIPIPNALIP